MIGLAELCFAPAEVEADIYRASYWEFFKAFFDQVIPENPVFNWHIKFLCDEVQAIAERVIKRLPKEHDGVVNIPPGTTKSTIVSIMLLPWMWTRDPSIRAICGSFEQKLALDFARKSREIVESEKYQRLFKFKQVQRKIRVGDGDRQLEMLVKRWVPSNDADAVPLSLQEDQNAKGHYETMAKGERVSIGVGGSVIGRHAHIILIDDPLNPKAALSLARQADVNIWMDETIPSRKVNKKVTPIILLMQRLHEDDPAGHMLRKQSRKKGNIRWICLPGTIRDNVRPKWVRKYYKKQGGYLDPVRLDQSDLDEFWDKLGKFGYAGQIDQDPVPRGGGMFEVEKFQMGKLPELSSFVKIVRYWDKAGSKGKGANSAGVMMGRDMWNRIWVIDVLKGQWSSTERERNIVQTAESDGEEIRIWIEQEPGSGGKESAENTIDRLEGYSVRAERPKGDKTTRAEPFASQVGIGKVFIPIGAPWWRDYRDELRAFPAGAKRDQVDASSGAYNKIKGAIRSGGRIGAL